ncbi:hypothetical protein ACFSKL_16545 [Belliella marina]|uniref:Uncharacterized protein n=1 Tax=Belliella marina TaxID=1644146 RepID=A0ABW4VRU6_9BACT
MKTSMLTQKNVCALLGLIMALTIIFSASIQVNKVKEDHQINISYSQNPETTENFGLKL